MDQEEHDERLNKYFVRNVECNVAISKNQDLREREKKLLLKVAKLDTELRQLREASSMV